MSTILCSWVDAIVSVHAEKRSEVFVKNLYTATPTVNA